MKRVIALLLALPLSACVGFYKDIDTSMPSATVTFSRGYEHHFPVGANQFYQMSYDLRCAEQKRIAVFGPIGGDTHDAQFEAGRRVVLIGETMFFFPATMGYTGVTNCWDATSFVPEAGHAYRAIQHSTFRGSCRLSIVDAATDAPPPSLQEVDHALCEPD